MLCFLFLDFLILLVWHLQDPLHFDRRVTETDSFGRPTESVGTCSGDNIYIYIITLEGIHFVLLLLANVLCYLTRQLHSQLAEAPQISVAVFNHMQLLAFALPLLYLLRDEPEVSSLVTALLIFLNYVILLLVIYVPKLMNLWQDDKEAMESVICTLKSSNDRKRSSLRKNSSSKAVSFSQSKDDTKEPSSSKRVTSGRFSKRLSRTSESAMDSTKDSTSEGLRDVNSLKQEQTNNGGNIGGL
ncbi:MAG: hypothetical protein AAGM67_18215 [Bacteroidota bacterium]